MLTDHLSLLVMYTLGSTDPSATSSDLTILNLHFILPDLSFKILRLKCRSMDDVVKYMDLLLELSGVVLDEERSNWEDLKGQLLWLRVKDPVLEITGLLSRNRKSIIKIKPESRF